MITKEKNDTLLKFHPYFVELAEDIEKIKEEMSEIKNRMEFEEKRK